MAEFLVIIGIIIGVGGILLGFFLGRRESDRQLNLILKAFNIERDIKDLENAELFFEDGTVKGIGTTTPAINADLSLDSNSTTTLYISSISGDAGGCIQIEGTASTTFHMYATTTGPIILNSGPCR